MKLKHLFPPSDFMKSSSALLMFGSVNRVQIISCKSYNFRKFKREKFKELGNTRNKWMLKSSACMDLAFANK